AVTTRKTQARIAKAWPRQWLPRIMIEEPAKFVYNLSGARVRFQSLRCIQSERASIRDRPLEHLITKRRQRARGRAASRAIEMEDRCHQLRLMCFCQIHKAIPVREDKAA